MEQERGREGCGSPPLLLVGLMGGRVVDPTPLLVSFSDAQKIHWGVAACSDPNPNPNQPLSPSEQKRSWRDEMVWRTTPHHPLEP